MNTIDEHNVKFFKTSNDAKEELYICTCCERLTNLLDSFSYMGYNLHCEHCIDKMVKATGIDEGKIINKISKVGQKRFWKNID